jgi:hypothetical protein
MRKQVPKSAQEIEIRQKDNILDKRFLSSTSSILLLCQVYLIGCLALIKIAKELIISKISNQDRKRLK